ncbi:MAG: gliding motility-associated ABC transporter permease subunit GldF [Flavobacteriales bacterium]
MLSLLFKEINSFLSTLIGYIVIIIFLLALSLFLWVFPGDSNIPMSGIASLEPMFVIAPWLFMFLIPAITMRSFAEEKRTGTLEFLLTKPITELQVILAKFFAGLLLVIIAVLPTFVYYFSIQSLGNPAGNIDSGATYGSYIGLIFLGGVFVSIGIFASSITDNQVISFITSLFLCFFFFVGFDYIGGLVIFSGISDLISGLGINHHYTSISRGVMDSRDLIYFLSVIVLFIMLTRIKLLSRKW